MAIETRAVESASPQRGRSNRRRARAGTGDFLLHTGLSRLKEDHATESRDIHRSLDPHDVLQTHQALSAGTLETIAK